MLEIKSEEHIFFCTSNKTRNKKILNSKKRVCQTMRSLAMTTLIDKYSPGNTILCREFMLGIAIIKINMLILIFDNIKQRITRFVSE